MFIVFVTGVLFSGLIFWERNSESFRGWNDRQEWLKFQHEQTEWMNSPLTWGSFW